MHVHNDLWLCENAEILGDGVGLGLLRESIPTKEELHVSTEQEHTFNRLLKFLDMHEPTGYEKDEAHKRTVVQYLALRSMLTECKFAKVSRRVWSPLSFRASLMRVLTFCYT